MNTDPNKNRKRIAKQGGNVVTYFCTPDLQVLGWVVGPVSADHVLSEAKRAVTAADTVGRLAGLDVPTRRERVREHYLSQMHAATRQRVRQWSDFRKETRHAANDESVARTLLFAKRTRDQTMGLFSAESSRLAKSGRARSPEFRATSTQMRNAISSDLSRIVISEFPLVKLPQLQRPVFESLAKQRFEPRSDRNTELLQAVEDSIAEDRPTLLVVGGDLRDSSKNSAVTSLLKRFTVLNLSLKDLTRLSDDLGHWPVEASSGAVRVVVLDARGKRTGVITTIRRGANRGRYRSVLSDPNGKPRRSLNSLLLSELKLATTSD